MPFHLFISGHFEVFMSGNKFFVLAHVVSDLFVEIKHARNVDKFFDLFRVESALGSFL